MLFLKIKYNWLFILNLKGFQTSIQHCLNKYLKILINKINHYKYMKLDIIKLKIYIKETK